MATLREIRQGAVFVFAGLTLGVLVVGSAVGVLVGLCIFFYKFPITLALAIGSVIFSIIGIGLLCELDRAGSIDVGRIFFKEKKK